MLNYRRIIPTLVGWLTFTKRAVVLEGVDFEWSNKLWTHNFFRVWELIFGRKYGVFPAFVAHIDSNGKKTVYVQSIEQGCAEVESYVRAFLGSFKLVPVHIYIPQLAGAGAPVRINSPYLFAIAYDSSAVTAFGASPRTVSLTTSGSNRILGMFPTTLNDTSTAPTYNAVASTTASIASSYIGSGRFGVRGYYLIAPATGANTASFGTSAGSIEGFVASYTGAKQSAQPDATGVTNTTVANAITTSVTTTVPSCMVCLCEVDSGAGAGPSFTAGTNVNAIRVSDTTLAGCLADGGPFGSGATNYTVNVLGAVPASLLCMVGIAFAPAPDSSHLLAILGAGA